MMRCRLYQSTIENQLDAFGCVRQPHLLRHLESCSCCRQFYRRLMQLERQLRTDSSGDVTDEQIDRMREAVSRRLGEGVSARTGSYHPQRPARYRLHTVITAAAALLLISVLGIYTARRVHTPTSDPAARFVSGSAALQNRMSVWVSLPQQSMQTELKKLRNDAQSAARFINNCIPANPTPPPPPASQTDSAP